MKRKKLLFILFIVCILSALFSVSAFAYDNVTNLDGDGLYFYEGALLPAAPVTTAERPVITIVSLGDMEYLLALHSGYTHQGADVWSIGSNAQFYSCAFGGSSWTATTSTDYSYDSIEIVYSNVSAANGSNTIGKGTLLSADGSHITSYYGLLDSENYFSPESILRYYRLNSTYLVEPDYLIVNVFGSPICVPVFAYPKIYNDVVIPTSFNIAGAPSADYWAACYAVVIDDTTADTLSLPSGVYLRSDLATVIGVVTVDAQVTVSPDNYTAVSLDTPIEFSTNVLSSYPNIEWAVEPSDGIVISNASSAVTNITFDSSVGDGIPVLVAAVHYNGDVIPPIGYSVVFTSKTEAPPDEGGGGDDPDDPQPPFWVVDI